MQCIMRGPRVGHASLGETHRGEVEPVSRGNRREKTTSNGLTDVLVTGMTRLM